MFETHIKPLGHLIVIGRQLILADGPLDSRSNNGVSVDLDNVFDVRRTRLADADELGRLRDALNPRPQRKSVAKVRPALALLCALAA